MAKRHPTLIPLSRDHYHDLLLALRLQQGKKALLKLWSHDPIWQAKYVVDFFERDLRRHFQAEEEALFPSVEEHIRRAQPIIQELLEEHRQIEERVAEFRNPSRRTAAEKLGQFGHFLEQHIRKEDRVLFPLIEDESPKEILAQVRDQMRKFYPSAKK